MITESDITLYSERVNPETREPEWTRTAINNVHWEESQGINIATSGLSNADKNKIYIPWTSMPAGVVIKPGDIIVKGIVSDVITTVSQLEKKYSSVAKVRTADVRKDAVMEQLWHVDIGGE